MRWLLALLLLSACASQGEIVIGVLASQTGSGAYLGQQEIRGVEIALDELNYIIAGRPVRVIVEDTASDPTTAVAAARKLMDVDGARYLIGDSWAATTIAIVPITNKNRIILISPLASLDTLSEDDYFFRTIPTTKQLSFVLADYTRDVMGTDTVAMLYSETDYGIEHARDFAARFERRGGRIVADQHFAITSRDLRAELLRVKDVSPDAILNIHASGLVGLPMKQASELGIDANWLGTFSAENANALSTYGSLMNGLTYPYPYDLYSSDPAVQFFVLAFQGRYGEMPDLTAANSYDALKVLAFAIETAGTQDPDMVKDALLDIKNYEGASGTISFDANGDVEKPLVIKQVQNGSFVKIWP